MTNLLTQQKVRSTARTVGFSTTVIPKLGAAPDKIISCIAMVEGVTDASMTQTLRDHIDYSDFDAIGDQALATDYWGFSYSGLQIRSIRSQKGTGKVRDEMRLPVPEFALRSAFQIWRDQGFEAWSTFNSGQWKAYAQDIFPTPPGVVIVKAGDTLGAIARREQMATWVEWARVNAIHDPNRIYIGQRLLTPWIVVTVKSGDTLTSIVAEYGTGVTVQRVAEFNGLPNPDAISVKQQLRIPRPTL